MRTTRKELLLQKCFAKAARLGCPAYTEQEKVAGIYKETMLRYSKRHGNPFDEKDAWDYIRRQFAEINQLHAQIEYPIEVRYA